ncbi:MAG: ketopantoate reductase family protein [Comamonadaceae bacterium]|nr:MAG: ketopantoate reductase family protein [Comamonadaceae bacterium]
MQGSASPRIAIVGAGAIGCRIAAHFAQHGIATTLFDGWTEHVRALQTDGLVLEGTDGREKRFDVTAYGYDAPALPAFDIVLLAVRSDDTQAALPLAQRLQADDGCIVSCQNGLNEEAVAAAVGAQRTLGCSLIFGARLTGPGRVRVLSGPDELHTGEYQGGDTPRLRRIVDLFGTCGTSTPTANLLGYRWMKLVLNSTGNPLLLLTGLDARSLHANETARRVIIAITQEILGTARANGVEVEPVLGVPMSHWLAPGGLQAPVLHEALRAHGDTLGTRRLSMVADFESRGRTEVDHINGYVVRKAQSLGREVPLNERVWSLVKDMEAGRRVAGVDVLQVLAPSLEEGAEVIRGGHS